MQYRAAFVLAGVTLVLAGISQAAELTASKKAPIPDANAQEASRKALAAVYGVRFKDAKTDTAKSALAKELVAAAQDVLVGSSDQFVLLKIACSIAAGAGDAATVMDAIVGFKKSFDMPLAKLAAESLLTAAGRASGYSRHKDVAETALFVAGMVGDAGEYELALRLCEVGQSSAKEARQHKLGDQLLAKVEELKREQKEFQKYREAIARIEREPHEPAANLAAGRYLCFVLGDWDGGLTMLALGADAELKSAALKDLKGGTSAEEQLAIGDVWWDLAEKEAVLPKERFQQRAAWWYASALQGLTGLAKTKAAKRLLEVFPNYTEVATPATTPPATSATTPAARRPEVPAALTNSIGMRFVLIPAGEFDMGSTEAEVAKALKELGTNSPQWMIDLVSSEAPRQRVRITKPFYLGMCEVTQMQYQAVMGRNPSKFTGDPTCPVETVSWEDASAFCRKLGELPAERTAGAKYRLPTEAEWEYACRAGTKTTYHSGDDVETLLEHAWLTPNAGGKTHPVGQKSPNAWGLYDMHGNVFEWCQDRVGDGGKNRVDRGGSYSDGGTLSRAAFRIWDPPSWRAARTGFRVARSVSD